MEPLPCYICDHKTVFYSKSLLHLKSKQSKTKICDFIKRLLGCELPDRFTSASIDENAVACTECLNKIDEYDLACVTVKRVEEELREILLHTASRYQEANEIKLPDIKEELQDFENGINYESIKNTKCNSKENIVNKMVVITSEKVKNNYDNLGQYQQEFNNGSRKRNTHLSFTCKMCDCSFNNDVDLYIHTHKHSKQETTSINKIINTSTRNRVSISHQCPICLETFCDKNSLEIHERKHIKGGEPSEILIEFEEANVEEIEDEVTEESISWPCRKCPADFFTKEELVAHVKSHFTPEDRCPICGIDSKNMAEAKEHMKSHRNIPPTQCTICHNDFPQKGALVRHTRIHFAQSAFNQCEKCGKGFHRKSSFEGHLMAHNDIRLEICPHPNCARKFRSTSHLNRHLQSHSADKPHSCTECGKKFNNRFNLRVHQQLHIPDGTRVPVVKMHKCIVCELTFDRPSKLTVHHRKVHEMLSPPSSLENTLDKSNEVRRHWIQKKTLNK